MVSTQTNITVTGIILIKNRSTVLYIQMAEK